MSDKTGIECPGFLCMGFQKCGTTTLYEILKQHSDVALSRDVKEPMYYRVQGLWLIGRKSYYLRRYYGHIPAGDPRQCGEVNAGLTFSGCAKKICHDFPKDTKLIFMMRNPVDRAYSAYKYFLARGFLPSGLVNRDREIGHAASFDQYVHDVLDDPHQERQIMKKRLKYLVFSQSCYYSCIREYLHYFPRENIKLVFFEEFIRDEKEASRDIFRFLGISDRDDLNFDVVANEGNMRAVSDRAAKKYEIAKGVINYTFYEFLGMPYWAPGLYGRLRKYLKNVRRKTFIPDDDKDAMLPQTRTFLEQYYADEVSGIESLAGRSLSDLWYPADPRTAKPGRPAA